jgi:hypothetical protein
MSVYDTGSGLTQATAVTPMRPTRLFGETSRAKQTYDREHPGETKIAFWKGVCRLEAHRMRLFSDCSLETQY